MKYVSLGRWLVLAAVVGGVAWQSLVSTQPLSAVTGFTQRTPIFQMIQPPNRVQAADRGVSVVAEPLYFDVRVPLRAASLMFRLTATADSMPVKLGLQQSNGWQFTFPDVTVERSGAEVRYSFQVPVSALPVQPDHTTRIILSAPNLTPGRLTLVQAQALFTRP